MLWQLNICNLQHVLHITILFLCSLDNEVRHIPSIGTRNSVYSHLSSFLPINRETLMKRMKLLRQKELTNNLQEPIEQLKAGEPVDL